MNPGAHLEWDVASRKDLGTSWECVRQDVRHPYTISKLANSLVYTPILTQTPGRIQTTEPLSSGSIAFDSWAELWSWIYLLDSPLGLVRVIESAVT